MNTTRLLCLLTLTFLPLACDGSADIDAPRPSAASERAAPKPVPSVESGEAAKSDEPLETEALAPEPEPEPVHASVNVEPDTFASAPSLAGDAPIPAGAIGAADQNGVHLDSLVIGRGFANSRCETETGEFSVASDGEANLCIRVVHGGAIESPLTVKWARANGRGPKATSLTLRGKKAYRTRAYLPIRAGSIGHWTVTVSSSDGTVLGSGEFDIAP
jgi:hypothetical protein